MSDTFKLKSERDAARAKLIEIIDCAEELGKTGKMAPMYFNAADIEEMRVAAGIDTANIQAEGREPRKGNDEDSATVIASALNRLADINGLAHELFAVAQLMPGEGIEDAVNRIEAVLIGSANTPNEVQR